MIHILAAFGSHHAISIHIQCLLGIVHSFATQDGATGGYASERPGLSGTHGLVERSGAGFCMSRLV